jgi:Flp pilus assembly protein TadG
MPMRRLRKFLRDDGGAVAIEMAIVGPPFILLMLTIIEMGLTLLTQAVLDGATRDAARLIRSGQIAAVGGADQQRALFQRTLCSGLRTVLIAAKCADAVAFDVEPVSGSGAPFAQDASCTRSVDARGAGAACPFDIGASGQIIAVRVQYRRPFIMPWVGSCLNGGCWPGGAAGSGAGMGAVLQTSVSVFRRG